MYRLVVPLSSFNLMPVLLCYCCCSPLSEKAVTVGGGFAVPEVHYGYMPMAEVFKLAISSTKVNDWNPCGNGT